MRFDPVPVEENWELCSQSRTCFWDLKSACPGIGINISYCILPNVFQSWIQYWFKLSSGLIPNNLTSCFSFFLHHISASECWISKILVSIPIIRIESRKFFRVLGWENTTLESQGKCQGPQTLPSDNRIFVIYKYGLLILAGLNI